MPPLPNKISHPNTSNRSEPFSLLSAGPITRLLSEPPFPSNKTCPSSRNLPTHDQTWHLDSLLLLFLLPPQSQDSPPPSWKKKNNPWTLACSHSQGQIPSRPNITLSPGHVLPRGPGQFQTPSYIHRHTHTHTHTHTHKPSQMLNPPTLFTDSPHNREEFANGSHSSQGKQRP